MLNYYNKKFVVQQDSIFSALNLKYNVEILKLVLEADCLKSCLMFNFEFERIDMDFCIILVSFKDGLQYTNKEFICDKSSLLKLHEVR